MSRQVPAEDWLTWHEPKFAGLSDNELVACNAYWRSRSERYGRDRSIVDPEHPDAYRWGYSAWWRSKYESMGLREAGERA